MLAKWVGFCIFESGFFWNFRYFLAVDRSLASSMKEAKDAMVMVAADYLSAYAQILTSSSKSATLLSPYALRMVPLYMLSLIKSVSDGVWHIFGAVFFNK